MILYMSMRLSSQNTAEPLVVLNLDIFPEHREVELLALITGDNRPSRVLREASDEVSRRVILANVECSWLVPKHEGVAGNSSASQSSRRLPDHLGEVRGLWIVRIVID
jgi:hypothetical protein